MSTARAMTGDRASDQVPQPGCGTATMLAGAHHTSTAGVKGPALRSGSLRDGPSARP